MPAFWAGGRRWRARYSSGELGEHRFRTECSDSGNAGLHGRTGSVRVVEAASENPLFRHGPIRLGPSRTHLEHADGTPFFWLADTWWMGLAERLRWPEDVRRLTRDRVAKGFTVVQIVAGLYPDMEPFDERARNEAGFPWDKGFSRINPAYFDAADPRITHVVESGVAPSGRGRMSPARCARWIRSAGRSRSIRPVPGAPRWTIHRCWTSRCCRLGTWASRRSRTRSIW